MNDCLSFGACRLNINLAFDLEDCFLSLSLSLSLPFALCQKTVVGIIMFLGVIICGRDSHIAILRHTWRSRCCHRCSGHRNRISRCSIC